MIFRKIYHFHPSLHYFSAVSDVSRIWKGAARSEYCKTFATRFYNSFCSKYHFLGKHHYQSFWKYHYVHSFWIFGLAECEIF